MPSVLVPAGALLTNYQAYSQNIGSCSAGCYQAFTTGQQTFGDSWCNTVPGTTCPLSIANIASQLSIAGLTSAMFCEDGCSRHADHFPWIGYTNTTNSCVGSGAITTNCSGQTGIAGDALYNSVSSNTGNFTAPTSNAGNSALISYLNGTNPANYIWLTPSDNHNMHDVNPIGGDNYLSSLICGCGSGGTLAAPNSGTILSTTLWKAGHTMLFLWWDEYSNPPQIFYGPTVRSGFSSSVQYDEYNALHTLEQNFGLPYITSVVSGDSGITDIFTSASVSPSTLSYIYSSHGISSQTSTLSTSIGQTFGLTYSYTYSCSVSSGTCTPTNTGPNWTNKPSSVTGNANLTLVPNAGCTFSGGATGKYCTTFVNINATTNGLTSAQVVLTLSICYTNCPQHR